MTRLAALTDDDFAAAMAAFDPFEHEPGIAVGVSGGPDSMALALLLSVWAEARGGPLLALVVDHRLRAASTTEAASVVDQLQALGIKAQILTRTGGIPESALQATARSARYALLEQATADAGFLHLATAHHRRDQLETVALRREGGSGPRGMAGMAAVRELDRVRLIRPLLAIEPARLRQLLERRGIPWLDDPANRDRRFWRARFRAEARTNIPQPNASAVRAAEMRQALDRRIAAWLAAHGRPHPLGFISAPATAFSGTADDLLSPLLSRLIVATAGGIWPPGEAKLERLRDWLRSGTSRRLTLGGVLVERAGKGLIRFVREPRAVAAPAALPRSGMLWDGRFRIDWSAPSGPVTVAKAGPGWRQRLPRESTAAIPAVVLETLPLVSVDGLAVALGPWRLGGGAGDLHIRFRPCSRYADVPFGQTVSASVASPHESLMYDKA